MILVDVPYLCDMKSVSEQDPTPPDCFPLEALNAFQSFEGDGLSDVWYYLWLNRVEDEQAPYRFLYLLELVFDTGRSLMLSSGDDSEAILLSNAEALEKTARQLQTLHGVVSIQKIQAGNFPLWAPLLGKTLEAIRLSRTEEGLYNNDALLFDFGVGAVLLHLAEKEGLALAPWDTP